MCNIDAASPHRCTSCTSSLSNMQEAGINNRFPMLGALTTLGDSTAIDLGKVVIITHEGIKITNLPQEIAWAFAKEIIELLRIKAFNYTSHSTGIYEKKYPGLTLQLLEGTSDEIYYTIFNVEITRKRTTKYGRKGELLPAGNFRVGKRSSFCNFWHSTQIAFPPRLSSFHDYMGNLKNIVLIADEVEGRPGRLNAQTLRPLSVSAEEISRRFLADNNRTVARHEPDSEQTSVPDNIPAQSQQTQAMQGDPATCVVNRENQLIRAREYKGAVGNPCQPKRPENQSDDEWLADYERPAREDDLN